MIEFLAEYGYWGLFVGSMLAATLIPLSSEALLLPLLYAGADPVSALIAATLGNWIGGMSSYGLGRLGKLSWLKISPEKVERQRERIERWGSLLAFFTWFPFVGDVLAVGLGVYRVDWRKVALFMLLGKGARFVVSTLIYYQFFP